MSLDFDTQAIMMSYLKKKDHVLAFMRTNRAHYDAGFHRLLQFRIVVHGRRLEDFCDFMLSGSISRLPGLRQISFEGSWGWFKNPANSHIVGRLISVLQGARHIKKLNITNCEAFLELDPQVGSAIASLEHLESLLLHGATQDLSRGLLKNLTSPVTTLDLALLPEIQSLPTPPAGDIREYPTAAIATLAPSLEHLTLHRASLDGNIIQFPKVESLIMNLSHCPDKACLVHTFPNLQKLSFETVKYYFSMDRDEARKQRQVNRAVDQGGKTITLKYLSARLVDIYSWGFSGEIEEIEVTKVLRYQHGMLPVVLNDALPRKLELNLSMNQTSSGEIVRLLPDSIGPRLEDLRVNIELRMNDSDESYVEVLTQINEVLRARPGLPFIDSIQIRLIGAGATFKTLYSGIRSFGDADDFLLRVLPEKVAKNSLRNAPSLKDICVIRELSTGRRFVSNFEVCEGELFRV